MRTGDLPQLTATSRALKLPSLVFGASKSIPDFLLRPEYLWRPSQLVHRLWQIAANVSPQHQVILPWGAPIIADPSEHIGGCLWRTGVYDLVALESLVRLADPGELALDVGANFGLMTCALASAVGRDGRVICFEPHPLLLTELRENLELWRRQMAWDHVDVRPVALSDTDGSAPLIMPTDFASNRGRSTLESLDDGDRVTVETRTLDAVLLADDPSVGVMKIDIEGHEYKALEGAAHLLADGRIRDIVFEEYDGYPSPVTRLLESYDYTIFALEGPMIGPRLITGPDSVHSVHRCDPPNYLATRDPDRAVLRFAHIGWQALRDAERRRRRGRQLR